MTSFIMNLLKKASGHSNIGQNPSDRIYGDEVRQQEARYSCRM